MARDIGPAGRKLIQSYELGPRGENPPLYAYLCPAGVPTIGWGHTAGVTMGMTCTRAQAEEWFTEDMDDAEMYTERALAGSPANDHEYSALVSCMFNCGPAFMKSTAIRRHRAGDKAGAAKALLDWNRAGGRVMPGLVRRRTEESALYLRPMAGTVAAEPQPSPQDVQPPAKVDKDIRDIAGSGSIAAGGAAGAEDLAGAARDVLPDVIMGVSVGGALKFAVIALAFIPLVVVLVKMIRRK